MKNTMKRVLSGLFCLMLLLSFCGTAFAVEQKGQLTVTGTTDAIGSTVEGYRLFTLQTEGTGNDITYVYTLNTEYQDFFTDTMIPNFSTMTAAQKSDAAYKYVLTLGADNSTEVKEFADQFIKWIHTNNKNSDLPLADGAAIKMAADTEDTAKSKATITDVPYGYYLIFVGHAPASLVNVKAGTNLVEVKSVYPTVDKEIVKNTGTNAEATSAEIGQSVKFSLTSAVPDMDGYEKYVFNFKDTMSKGLTFNDDVAVIIGAQTLAHLYVKEGDTKYYTDSACSTEAEPNAENGPAYVVTTATNGDNTDIKIELLNFIQYKDAAYKNASITVTYSATLNENAVVAGNGNTNSATVEYSNDPSSDSTGESTPEVVEVYTFDFNINKIAHGTNLPLAGAKFVLRRANTDSSPAIAMVKETVTNTVTDPDTNAETTTTTVFYRVAKTGETDTVTVMETDADGQIHIKGLAKGTYYLYETEAPENYNKLNVPVVIDITAETNPDGTLKNWYVNKTNDSSSGDNIVTVENRSGSTLPETGAIGTAIFAVVGVGLVIGGTQMMGRKKKEESEQ